MNINWLVRIKNKNFWMVIIPTVLLLIQQIAAVFGLQLDLGGLGNQLLEIVKTVFIILSVIGIVADPTTKGLSDSTQAMTYDKPKE